MNRLLSLLVGITTVLTLAHVSAATSNQLKTPTDKFSYLVGLNIGKTFKSQNTQVNPNQMLKGLQDGMSGAKPLLDVAQQKQVMMQYQQKMQKQQKQQEAKEQAAEKQEGVADAKAGKLFLQANKVKKGVVTTASGLQYKILTAGKGTPPGPTDKVTVNYEGTLVDGTVFDSSYKRGKPLTFAVDGVIKGWSKALQKMRPGATWMLYIPAKLAYGSHAMGKLIPPNSTLVFKVNLISVKKS